MQLSEEQIKALWKQECRPERDNDQLAIAFANAVADSIRAQADAVHTGTGMVKIEHVPAAAPTVTLRFEGYSDDTFGEVEHFGDDFDNAASGKPIRYLVTHPDVPGGMVVVGQYGREDVPGDWFIGVAGYDPDYADVPMPDWPMRIVRSERPYSPSLIIKAPAGVVIRCLERQEG